MILFNIHKQIKQADLVHYQYQSALVSSFKQFLKRSAFQRHGHVCLTSRGTCFSPTEAIGPGMLLPGMVWQAPGTVHTHGCRHTQPLFEDNSKVIFEVCRREVSRSISTTSFETVTEPRMTEPRKTEPRKTERQKTERRKTECQKGLNIERPNFEWDRTSKDWTSNGTERRKTECRKTEPRMGPNIERLNIEKDRTSKDWTSKRIYNSVFSTMSQYLNKNYC